MYFIALICDHSRSKRPKLLKAGVRQSNSKFNQGCSTNGQNKNPYSAFGTCETDNCNNFTNVCNLCSRCNEPTTIKQIVCTSKDSKCYVTELISSSMATGWYCKNVFSFKGRSNVRRQVRSGMSSGKLSAVRLWGLHWMQRRSVQ